MWIGGTVLRRKLLRKKACKDWGRRFRAFVRADLRTESLTRQIMRRADAGRSETKEVADDT